MLTKFDVVLKDFVNINYTKITETVRDFLLSKNGIPMITRWLTNTTGIVVNFIFGFIISIYMLIGKSDFSKGAKNIIYALFSDKRREKIYDVAQRANTIFSKFLFGKLIDSIIIGIIAYIFFLILGVRYSLLLAFIVGITNIIPYFGPLFGGVVVCSIVLFTNAGFIKFLIAVAGILLIQQFDGWILDPKILHGQIGINPLIIIAGVSIGGSIGGFIGMLIGVPLLALIKELFYDEYIMNKIKMKKCAEAAATEEHITDGGGDKEE